jgi:putative hydrolase of the HAD superfamily
LDLVDTVVSSADVGLRKPDPRIFELALERLDVAPSQAVHVGDHYYADMVGAGSVGMVPVLIDRHGGEQQGRVAFIRTLEELDGILGW